jgi:hypothetical protein
MPGRAASKLSALGGPVALTVAVISAVIGARRPAAERRLT